MKFEHIPLTAFQKLIETNIRFVVFEDHQLAIEKVCISADRKYATVSFKNHTIYSGWEILFKIYFANVVLENIRLPEHYFRDFKKPEEIKISDSLYIVCEIDIAETCPDLKNLRNEMGNELVVTIYSMTFTTEGVYENFRHKFLKRLASKFTTKK